MFSCQGPAYMGRHICDSPKCRKVNNSAELFYLKECCKKCCMVIKYFNILSQRLIYWKFLRREYTKYKFVTMRNKTPSKLSAVTEVIERGFIVFL